MWIGVLQGVLAGALWGLIYIAPLMVPEYNPVLVALSRFIMFGFVSLPFIYILRRDLKKFSRADVWEAFRLPFLGNVVFYSLITICIRLAGAPLAGMFMAVIPVLVAISSNFLCRGSDRALSWSAITPPLIVILVGAFGVAAVIDWTWFSIVNGEWLLAHPRHSSAAWTALQGVTVLPVVLVLFIIVAYPVGWLDTSVTILGPAPWRFLATALMIGLLCSWVAMYFWNAMSQRLPSALGGQLIVFESISSVVYAMMWRGEWPTVTMVVGYTILLAGVFGSLWVFRRADAAREEAAAAKMALQPARS